MEQTFFPPLWLARRTAAAKLLRQERIKSVIDFGCGSGTLLSILVTPTSFRDVDFPDSIVKHLKDLPFSSSDHATRYRQATIAQLQRVKKVRREEEEWSLERVVGVDIRTDSLATAVKGTAPPLDVEVERWNDVKLELYQGDASIRNEVFEGIEAIIASEVIEHLPPPLLPTFIDTVFSCHPRMLVFTTPNHAFNPYFVSRSKSDAENNRWPDPTGRTNRIFRDDDHVLEWTEEEFQCWANDIAERYSYTVEFSGVGSLSSYFHPSPIPFPPPSLAAHPALKDTPTSLALPIDPTQFFATQIAIFHRSATVPSSAAIPLAAASSPKSPSLSSNPATFSASLLATSPTSAQQPQLIHSHLYAAMPRLSPPPNAIEIIAVLRKIFEKGNSASRSLESIWNDSFELEEAIDDAGTTTGDQEEQTKTEKKQQDRKARNSLRKLCEGEQKNLIVALVEVVEDQEPSQREWEIIVSANLVEGDNEERGAEAVKIRLNRFVEVNEEEAEYYSLEERYGGGRYGDENQEEEVREIVEGGYGRFGDGVEAEGEVGIEKVPEWETEDGDALW